MNYPPMQMQRQGIAWQPQQYYRSQHMQNFLANSAETASNLIQPIEHIRYETPDKPSAYTPHAEVKPIEAGAELANAQFQQMEKSHTAFMDRLNKIEEHYKNNPIGSALDGTPVPNTTPTPDPSMPVIKRGNYNGIDFSDARVKGKIWDSAKYHFGIEGFGPLFEQGKQLVITSGQGARNIGIGSKYHSGFDIATPIGTVVLAPVNGKIIASGYDFKGGGGYVKLLDDFGNTHVMMHGSGVYHKVGDRVSKGTKIFRTGSTGTSTGAHLDYRIKDSDGFWRAADGSIIRGINRPNSSNNRRRKRG